MMQESTRKNKSPSVHKKSATDIKQSPFVIIHALSFYYKHWHTNETYFCNNSPFEIKQGATEAL